jgi:O-antigen ligase
MMPMLLGLAAAFVGVSVANERWVPGAVVAAAIAALGIGAFLLRRPEAALRLAFFLILLATTKFRERSATALLSGDIDIQVAFELACYAAALLAVAVNVLPAFRRRPALRFTRKERLLGAYVLLAATSTLWSENSHVTAGRAVQLAVLYILCAVAVRRLGSEPTLRTLAASVATYVVLAIGLAALFPWARHEGPLFSWFAAHPVDAGTFAGSAAVMMIAGAMYAREAWRPPLKRLALWAGVSICILALLAAHERAPVFAFVAGASVLWVRRHLRPWAAGLVLGAMLLLSVVGLRTLAASYSDAAAAPDFTNPVVLYVLRGQSGEEFLGLSGRTDLWDYESSLIRERPLIGHGYVASRSLMLDRFPWAGTSHGALPEVLLNCGLVGALLLGAVVLGILTSAFSRTEARDAPGAWGQAMVLGSVVFLMVLAGANDSFAGAPGYETLVFFAAAMAHEHLGQGPRTDAG